MVKFSKDIKMDGAHADTHTGKKDKTSKNNEIADKLASCSIKTRILKHPMMQIQNKSARMIEYTGDKQQSFKVYP